MTALRRRRACAGLCAFAIAALVGLADGCRQAGRTFFAACEQSDDCLSGLCYAGRCTQVCGGGVVCPAGSCLEAVCTPDSGATCASDAVCVQRLHPDPCHTATCAAGTCSLTEAVQVCDDGNACTEDACDPASGCRTAFVTDGVACGTGGACVAGSCSGCGQWQGCGATGCLDAYRSGSTCEGCLAAGVAPSFPTGLTCAAGLVPVPRDGQSICVADLPLWGVLAMPVPGDAGFPNFAPGRFVEGGDGTVRDTATCRQWQKEASADGLCWPATTSGSCAQSDVVAYCDALTTGGHQDWRVPTQAELESLLDLGQDGSTCYWDALFAGACGWYWSATPSLYDGKKWSLTFTGGTSNFTAAPGHVRCVR